MGLRDLLGAVTSTVGILMVGAVFLPNAATDHVTDLFNGKPALSPGDAVLVPDLTRAKDDLTRVLKELDPRSGSSPAKPSGRNGAAPKGKPASPAPPKLYDGRILFEPERTMQLRHAEVVMVRMDAGASPDLEAGIDPKHYKIDSVKVARRMRVHLDGDPPDAFEIVPMLPPDEQQAVTNLSASTWMWNVTPKKNGAAALLLHIWALAKVEDSDTLVPLFQKTETIHVHGIPLPEVNAGGFWEKVLEGAGEHMGEAIAVLFGAGLTALGGWIARWWRKPKSAAARRRPRSKRLPR